MERSPTDILTHTHTLFPWGRPRPPANCKTAMPQTLYWWDSSGFHWLVISPQLFSQDGWLTFLQDQKPSLFNHRKRKEVSKASVNELNVLLPRSIYMKSYIKQQCPPAHWWFQFSFSEYNSGTTGLMEKLPLASFMTVVIYSSCFVKFVCVLFLLTSMCSMFMASSRWLWLQAWWTAGCQRERSQSG